VKRSLLPIRGTVEYHLAGHFFEFHVDNLPLHDSFFLCYNSIDLFETLLYTLDNLLVHKLNYIFLTKSTERNCNHGKGKGMCVYILLLLPLQMVQAVNVGRTTRRVIIVNETDQRVNYRSVLLTLVVWILVVSVSFPSASVCCTCFY